MDYLTLRGIFHYKNNTTGIYKVATGSYIPSQSVGAPDITCIVKGIYVGLEVKRPKGKHSDAQKRFGEAIISAGGAYYVVHSLDEVMDIMESYIGRATKKTP